MAHGHDEHWSANEDKKKYNREHKLGMHPAL